MTKRAAETGARGILVADLRTTPDFDSFSTGKSNIVYIQADVSQWSDFDKIFDICEQKWNDVPDAYAICAGIFEPSFSNFWLDTEEDGYKSVAVNVNHPIKLTRLAIRKSVGRGKRASVCIIASQSGLAGLLSVPLYCATKHAVVGFVKSLKDSEPLTGVKVTTICPGLVDTPLSDANKQKQFPVSDQKAMTADEVAQHIVELLEKKEYACGTVLELASTGKRLIPEWSVLPPENHSGVGQEQARDAFIKHMLEYVEKKLQSEKANGGSKP